MSAPAATPVTQQTAASTMMPIYTAPVVLPPQVITLPPQSVTLGAGQQSFVLPPPQTVVLGQPAASTITRSVTTTPHIPISQYEVAPIHVLAPVQLSKYITAEEKYMSTKGTRIVTAPLPVATQSTFKLYDQVTNKPVREVPLFLDIAKVVKKGATRNWPSTQDSQAEVLDPSLKKKNAELKKKKEEAAAKAKADAEAAKATAAAEEPVVVFGSTAAAPVMYVSSAPVPVSTAATPVYYQQTQPFVYPAPQSTSVPVGWYPYQAPIVAPAQPVPAPAPAAK